MMKARNISITTVLTPKKMRMNINQIFINLFKLNVIVLPNVRIHICFIHKLNPVIILF